MPTTRSQPLAKAISTVLSTPELLTLILSHLPPHSLLLAQRTSKTWRTLTQKQPLLRRILFLDPSSEEPPRLNPLLTKAFPLFFRTAPFRRSDFHSLPWSKNADAFKRKGASWREMLVLSTGGEVRAVRRWSHWGSSSELVGKVAGGLKMGVCWDVTRSLCGDGMGYVFWCWRDEVEIDGEGIGGVYESRYGETEELEIRVESSVGCVATSWAVGSEAEKAYEKDMREREEEDAFFGCEGIGKVGVVYGKSRDTYDTMIKRVDLEEYAREMAEAANMPLPDEDDAEL